MMDAFEQSAADIDPAEGVVKRPALTLDVALYEQYLEGEDLTDAEKHQFLEALWTIVVQFVDLGFGIHPLQSVHSEGSEGSISLQEALSGMIGSGSSEKPETDRPDARIPAAPE